MRVSPVTLAAGRLAQQWLCSLRTGDSTRVLPCLRTSGVAEGSGTTKLWKWRSREECSYRRRWDGWDGSALPMRSGVWLVGVFSRLLPCWVFAFDCVLPRKPFPPWENRLIRELFWPARTPCGAGGASLFLRPLAGTGLHRVGHLCRTHQEGFACIKARIGLGLRHPPRNFPKSPHLAPQERLQCQSVGAPLPSPTERRAKPAEVLGTRAQGGKAGGMREVMKNWHAVQLGMA